jgi:mRNA-degrading endonuclease RelE of RelBE toxin-antitoxin system
VGDYRFIATIQRAQLHVLVIKVGHRSTVYE